MDKLNFWKSTIKPPTNHIDYTTLNKMDCSNQVGCPYTQPMDVSWCELQKKMIGYV